MDHHAGDPVQRAGKRDDARQQTVKERAAPRRSVDRERKQERRQRDPRDRRVTVSRKTEREEDAGSGG